MFLKQLSLINFKNYPDFEASFSQKINCFVGSNGVGKTNLLDAIHYLSFCKSFFNSTDSQNIRHAEGFFVIQGTFDKGGEENEIFCGIKRQQKKVFRKNKTEYGRLSEHIGQFPLVMISPGDTELINGHSEVRRKFLDGIISQYDKVYLDNLIAYNQALKQRNALLKQFAESAIFDSESLDIWDEQLSLFGKPVVETRKEFLKLFIPLFDTHYAYMSGGSEKACLHYESSLAGKDFKTALMASLPRDRAQHYTGAGPHKDDLEFTLSGYSLKKYASQGQQKSYLLALKLAQFEFIKQQKNTKPLLLLDDVYDKLDEERFTRLLQMVSDDAFGQVFITDTHHDRIHQALDMNKKENRIFIIDNDKVPSHAPPAADFVQGTTT